MVHRKTSSFLVEILSMSFLEQPKKIDTSCKMNGEADMLVERIMEHSSSSRTRSHNRSQSLTLVQYKAFNLTEHNNINSFKRSSLKNKATNEENQVSKHCERENKNREIERCIHLNRVHFSSFDDEIRDENSNSVPHNHNLLERFMLQHGALSIFDNKNIKNNVDACLFYDANDLTNDEKKALITQNMLFSPSKSTPDYNNTTTREQLATLMSPDDAAPITSVPSNEKKKMKPSPNCNSNEKEDSAFPIFIACNKIPFKTFESEVVGSDNSSSNVTSNKPKEYYYQNNNNLRSFPMKPRSEYNFQSVFPERLHLPDLRMDL